jgi:hypothetical protein
MKKALTVFILAIAVFTALTLTVSFFENPQKAYGIYLEGATSTKISFENGVAPIFVDTNFLNRTKDSLISQILHSLNHFRLILSVIFETKMGVDVDVFHKLINFIYFKRSLNIFHKFQDIIFSVGRPKRNKNHWSTYTIRERYIKDR